MKYEGLGEEELINIIKDLEEDLQYEKGKVIGIRKQLGEERLKIKGAMEKATGFELQIYSDKFRYQTSDVSIECNGPRDISVVVDGKDISDMVCSLKLEHESHKHPRLTMDLRLGLDEFK